MNISRTPYRIAVGWFWTWAWYCGCRTYWAHEAVVRRRVKKLVASGLIEEITVGGQDFYQIKGKGGP